MKKNYLLILLIASVLLSLAYSCKETVDLEPLPQNKMLEYKVSNLADTVIYGAINNLENTITVYVPFYTNLSIIDPRIKVEEGARLEGEILPVAINDSSKTYTVTSADGRQRVYKLRIVSQNTPGLELAFLDATALNTFPLAQLPIITGNFLSTNRQAARVILKHRTSGKQFELDKNSGQISVTGNGSEYALQQVSLPANIDTGYFDVQVKFLGHEVTLAEPVHVIHRQPRFSIAAITASPGDEITYTTFNSVVLGLQAVTVSLAGKIYDCAIISSDLQSVTIKLPDDLPPGIYTDYEKRPTVTFSFDGWAHQASLQPMTISNN